MYRPSETEINAFVRLYSPPNNRTQRGRGLDDLQYYRSSYTRQRGAGLGSIFGSIAKHLIPFAKNILWPAAKKYVLPAAAGAATGLAEDILAGKNVKQSLKAHSSAAIQDIGSTAIKRLRDKIPNQSQAGSGRKRKRGRIQSQPRVTKKRKITKRRNVKILF